MRPDELSRRLKLDEIAKNHTWKVEPSCATTGEGIFEGLVSSIISCFNLFTNDAIPGLAWPECQNSSEIDDLYSASVKPSILPDVRLFQTFSDIPKLIFFLPLPLRSANRMLGVLSMVYGRRSPLGIS